MSQNGSLRQIWLLRLSDLLEASSYHLMALGLKMVKDLRIISIFGEFLAIYMDWMMNSIRFPGHYWAFEGRFMK